VRTLLLGEGSIASSGSYFEHAHVDAITRTPMRARCVSVVADRCVVADALTKIVMSDADIAAPLLDAWNAEALVFDDDGARLLGSAA
jgi:thiamine biosynthesis lipoprotein ApbE